VQDHYHKISALQYFVVPADKMNVALSAEKHVKDTIILYAESHTVRYDEQHHGKLKLQAANFCGIIVRRPGHRVR
jgi:hypothetical protein